MDGLIFLTFSRTSMPSMPGMITSSTIRFGA